MTEDLSLRQDVERELAWQPEIRAAEIGVTAKDGIVTLSGIVDNLAAKRTVERAAARVPGVRAVSSQLQAGAPASKRRSDADIAWAAANALTWNVFVPTDRVRIEVSDGWVTLEGFVDWRFQRMAAEDMVSDLAGVEGVTNIITVCPAVPEDQLKREVEKALKENSKMIAHRIVVEAHGDCVTLWGSVASQRQREEAEQTAWCAPGVRELSNHITITNGVAAGS